MSCQLDDATFEGKILISQIKGRTPSMSVNVNGDWVIRYPRCLCGEWMDAAVLPGPGYGTSNIGNPPQFGGSTKRIMRRHHRSIWSRLIICDSYLLNSVMMQHCSLQLKPPTQRLRWILCNPYLWKWVLPRRPIKRGTLGRRSAKKASQSTPLSAGTEQSLFVDSFGRS